MKISKEAKIGFIGFIVFVTILYILNYLNRQNVFSRNLIITAQFENLDYIKKGEKVLIKGREYGRVVAIYKDEERLLVDLDIEPNTKIPKTASAVISEFSLMGGRVVSIVYDTTCESNCLVSGDVIPGTVYTLKEQVAAGAAPILKSIGKLADTIAGPNGIDKVLHSAYASLHSLKQTTDKAKGQLHGLKRTLPANIRNFKELTAVLLGATPNNSSAVTESMMSNRAMAMALDTLLHNLSSLDQTAIDSMTQLLYTAYEAAQKIPKQLSNINTIVTKTNDNLDSLAWSLVPYQKGKEGKVPQLLYNKTLRDTIQKGIKDFSNKTERIRENPEKYLSIRK